MPIATNPNISNKYDTPKQKFTTKARIVESTNDTIAYSQLESLGLIKKPFSRKPAGAVGLISITKEGLISIRSLKTFYIEFYYLLKKSKKQLLMHIHYVVMPQHLPMDLQFPKKNVYFDGSYTTSRYQNRAREHNIMDFVIYMLEINVFDWHRKSNVK